MRFLLLLAIVTLVQPSMAVHIAAFNIQTLGKTKMSKPDVVDYLVKIIDRYDLVVIQELRDSSGEAIVDLLNAVNAYSSDTYDMILGSEVGRSTYREQYVFMYRPSEMTVNDYYEYDEPNDEFEREPLIVRFQPTSSCAEQRDFAVVAIHIKPDDAVVEIDHLIDVYLDVVNRWELQDVAIVGDFNADCSYVKESDWPNIRLRSWARFHWLIPDETDTTVSQNTNCAYDRLVVAGNLISTAHSPSTFYFDSYYGLPASSDILKAGNISDHYPVEMIID